MNSSNPMTDDDVLRAVTGSVTGVRFPQPPPVEVITARARCHRRRRLISGGSGVLAVAGGAALALATLLPASQHPGHGAAAQLTAWTVVKQADGNIRVTIRELRDPAGLQRRLRADGVPASVTFRGQQNPACQGYRAVPATTSQRRHLMKSVVTFTQPGSYNVLIIHPSALPSDAGLVIENLVRQHPGSSLDVGLVQASPQCTGS